MLGLNRGTVKLVPYQKQWQDEFNKEKNHLLQILNIEIDIEHVGSTAVEDLISKPIIDILLGLTKKINAESVYNKLLEHGYEDRGDKGISGDRLFAKGSEECRTHYLHFVGKDSERWKNYLLFRDYLCKNKSTRDEYVKLKQELAKKFANNREAYTIAKSEFIEKLFKN